MKTALRAALAAAVLLATTAALADITIGLGVKPVSIAMADVAAEPLTVPLALSPAGLPRGKDDWTFRTPQSNRVMANAMVAACASTASSGTLRVPRVCEGTSQIQAIGLLQRKGPGARQDRAPA